MKIFIKTIIGAAAGFIAGCLVNIYLQQAICMIPELNPKILLAILGAVTGFLHSVKDKKIFIYQCPKCKKIIDDNDILLPVGGSVLNAWNPKNYYIDCLHFHCSKCRTHLCFKWLVPAMKIIGCQLIYSLFFIMIYMNSTLKDRYDVSAVIGEYYFLGLLIIFVVCYFIYSRKAKIEILTEDVKARKKAEPDIVGDNSYKNIGDETDPEEPEPIQYDLGYPGFNDMPEGVLVIEGANIVFKDPYCKDKVFFYIPVEDVVDVKTDWKLLSSGAYNAMGAMGGSRNYLWILFNQDGKECNVMFATTMHNKQPGVLEKIRERILRAKNR